MDILYIVMPAYNEESNIEDVVKSWYQQLDGKDDNSRLVIADSGSIDNTHKIIMSLKERFEKLEVLSDTDKQHGPKVIALYKYAIEKGADYIFQTDSDGQTDASEFDDFWKLRELYDAVIGNRIDRGDGWTRKVVEKVVCLLLYVFFGVRVPDANAPFRLMRCSVVSKYINKMPSYYALPNIIITTYLAYYKDSLLFKRISFKSRQSGTNSINLVKIIRIGINALKDFSKFRRNMR